MMSLLDRAQNASPENCKRLVVLGSSKVGKTAIVSRFLYDRFDDTYSPTIENFHRKIYKIRGTTYCLDILDTAGNHPFPAMRRLKFVTGDMFMLVYDVTCRHSFREVQEILKQLTKCRRLSSTDPESILGPVPIILVGNKCDLNKQRCIPLSEARSLSIGRPLFVVMESSAKDKIKIDQMFLKLFDLAKLPEEMCPSLHRKVSLTYTGSGKKRGLSIRRKVSEACGVVHPNARRPSVRADLHMAQIRRQFRLQRNDSKENYRCVIQ